MRIRLWLSVLAGGGALIAALAALYGMGPTEAIKLAVMAAVPAALVGAVGFVVLLRLRGHSIGLQTAVTSAATLLAVTVGVVVAAEAMFFTQHDLHTFLVILTASMTIGLLLSSLLAQRVGSAGRSLSLAARRMAGGDLASPIEPPATREFAQLAKELAVMSRRLDEARARERSLDASRRELVACVSHDLRTPLAGIRAMAEALEDGVVSEPDTVHRYYTSLRRETERLAALVDDLFELSRINSGALRIDKQRVSLFDLVSDTVAASTPAAERRGIHLNGRVTGVPQELELSPPEVSRALRNLVENAIRHTPSDGSIWIEAGVDEQNAYVSVRDQCGGIPDDDLDRVFELSFRGEAARTPEDDRGAGLGLAIARGIVEAHHGKISVRNERPGCRFTVQLPIGTPA